MQTNSLILEQTTQAQLKDLISAGVKEALESLRAELKSTPISQKLTRQQVKDEFHISYPTILKYEKQGKIKGYRVANSKRVLFYRLELEEALTQRKFL